MKILFTSGIGILPEQRIHRWKMVSLLYSQLAVSFRLLGHEVYFAVNPECVVDEIPSDYCMLCDSLESFSYIINKFEPDFVFCWNGGSQGDVAISTIANTNNAKMIYSEQGWFPQKDTIYFDFQGCNAKSSIKSYNYKQLEERKIKQLKHWRQVFFDTIGWQHPLIENGAERLKSVRKVFVPLQDERDLNIVQDSPFKSMDEFLQHICEIFPDEQIIARPHPKYPNPKLSNYDNVTLDNPKKPMFETLWECDIVAGINSTTLLESSLLGFPVLSFGTSLATGTGLFIDCSIDDTIEEIRSRELDLSNANAVLHELLCVRQYRRDELGEPTKLMQSWLFKEMVRHVSWNKIFR